MVLTSGLKKIIGTKAFYKAALAFAIPLILQDTVSSFVNLLDNMMIGSLGTEQMSGVAIVNQFIMCIYGGVAGANIFAAQYIGNNDNKNAQHAIRFNFIMVTCFSALFIAVMYLFQDKLISAFLHISSGKGDLQATLQYGKEYLKIMESPISLAGLSFTMKGKDRLIEANTWDKRWEIYQNEILRCLK